MAKRFAMANSVSPACTWSVLAMAAVPIMTGATARLSATNIGATGAVVATAAGTDTEALALALALGIFIEKVGTNSAMRTFLIIGFCGGFSTFSTFSFETVELIRSGNMFIAFTNILLSVTACVALIYFLIK